MDLPLKRRGTWWFGLALAVVVAGCGDLPSEQNANSTTAADAKPSGGPKPVVFVGFDASPPLVEAMRVGQLRGLVLQDPVKMGATCVKTLVAHLEKESIEPKISTGELLATPENMNDADVSARLDPPKVTSATDAGATGPKQKKYRIIVIPKGTTHVFWQSVHYGVNQAAEALGNVEVVWLAPTKEDDRIEQIQLVQRAVAAKMDGIVIAPLDSQALAQPVEEAVDAGVPVLIMDSALNSEKPIAYVATDNYHGGVLGAERLAQLLNEQGRIILMRYAPNSEATEQREAGFLDTIKKYPKIEILSQDQYAGATAESAQRVAERLVLLFKGKADGIFTPNESSTAGMLRALLDAGMLPAGK